jgi:hypothetical protein
MAATAPLPLVRIVDVAHQQLQPRWERCLWAHRPKLPCSEAALLEFLTTAAGTRVVSSNAFERIFEALAADTISPCLSLPPFLIGAILLGEAVPSGQLFYGIAEKRAVAIIWKPGFVRVLHTTSEILSASGGMVVA